MARSDLAQSGVMFTLDTESGFKNAVFITSSYGLGENIVQGAVIPDEFYVFKPTFRKGFKSILKKRLGTKMTKMVYGKNGVVTQETPEEERQRFSITDEDILELSRMALIIEDHYSKRKGSECPMDIEWAKCGTDNKIYIVQARPETVQSNKKRDNVLETYVMQPNQAMKKLVEGKSIGSKIYAGKARVCESVKDMAELKRGEILITDFTDPDMEPYMAIAGGIVTQRGGRTCHAAIISREMGIPAIVGAADACTVIKTGMVITLACNKGDVGVIYDGMLKFELERRKLDLQAPKSFDIMLNVANPDECFETSLTPNKGVGLARMEFIINNAIQVHPMALIHPEQVTEESDRQAIRELIRADPKHLNDPQQFFVDKLAQEAGTIAAAFHPYPVIVRMSDFKSNEYKCLLAGKYFEPDESNAMIGFRGCSRYYHEKYREAFVLECRAMRKIREEMGLNNVKLMLPFVRTLEEAKKCIDIMAENGLKRGVNGLELYMMVEIPANVILIDEFSELFDGFSIGSNDLTQTTLAVDRDSELVAPLFDERNIAVLKMLSMAIRGAKRNGRKIGICGQGPSDFPDLAEFLIKEGIDSISLNADSVIGTMMIWGGK
jgi:pyruvate,water dikinase